MKEQDLIDLGFEKNIENNYGKPFYYYYWEPYEMSGIGLLSSENDVVQNDIWKVYMFEDERVIFSNVEDVKIFIDVIKRNTHT